MANKKTWLGMLVMVLVLGILMVGCSSKGVVGTWTTQVQGQNVEFTFKSDGTWSLTVDGRLTELIGRYIVSESTITVMDPNSGSNFTGTFDKNTLLLNWAGDEWVLTKQ